MKTDFPKGSKGAKEKQNSLPPSLNGWGIGVVYGVLASVVWL